MGKWTKFVGIFAVVCLLVSVTAIGIAAEKKLVIGFIGPYTGVNARTGLEVKSGLQEAFERIDYKIGDYKVEFALIDSQSDPAKATGAYAEAVERLSVQATVGNWHSSVAAAVMDLAADYRVPHMGAMGAAKITTDKYKDNLEKFKGYWMKGWATPTKLSVSYVDCLEDAIKRGLWTPPNKKMGIYGADADWERETAGALKREFTKLGWEVVAEDYIAYGQTDFYPLVNKYRSAKVSLIAGSMSPPPMVSAFLKQSSEVGLEAVNVCDGLAWVGEWYKLTGSSSNYVIDMQPRWATAEAKQFAKEMEEKYGYKPAPSATGIPYDTARHLIRVCQRALDKHGKLDKETIHQVIVDEVCTGKLDYTAEDGAFIVKSYKYSPETYNDPVVARDAFYFPVLQYMNGQSRLVYPTDWKEADFSAPH